MTSQAVIRGDIFLGAILNHGPILAVLIKPYEQKVCVENLS